MPATLPERSRAWILFAAAIAPAAQAQRPDTTPPPPEAVLLGGKIVTVDESFRIAEAVAIGAGRITAVGSNTDIAALADPVTLRIDLAGRTVIPGLIDNHMHLLRAGRTWQQEIRLDGVESRAGALARLAERADAAAPGEWLYTLGGWTVDQFADDASAFTRSELDAAAPENPVFLQASYRSAYMNSAGLAALGFGSDADPDLPSWIVTGTDQRPTGEIAEAGLRAAAARLPAPDAAAVAASTRAMVADLNAAGLTTVGSAGCPGDLLPMYRRWAEQDELNLRVFCIDGSGAGSPAQVDQALAAIATFDVAGGDDWIDRIAFGEGLYFPLHDPMFEIASYPTATDLDAWQRLATGIARAGLPLHVHANFAGTLDGFLDAIERIDAEYPIRPLRWALAHANQLEPRHLERMEALGVAAAVHPWAVINGGINQRVFGAAADTMPPLRTIEDSGILWGFGSDGSRANQVLPFRTLAFAVTGRMVGGREVLRETITREEALIAHTRRNAWLVFREDRIGSIEPGKLADLVVLDRDYLTVPAEEIAEISAVMTIVGGRVVHDMR